MDEEIGSQEVEVEEVIDASIDNVHTSSNICHYFVNVDEDDSNTRKTTHVDEELEDCGEETCPFPQISWKKQHCQNSHIAFDTGFNHSKVKHIHTYH